MYALTLVIGAAWAATVEYPLMAEITFTPDGVSRFSVPPELRSSEDPDDQSDLLLIDGNGQRVPVAWMRGEGGEQILSPALDAGLEVRPIRGDAFQVTVSERPVDALRISLEEGPAAIEYTLESVDGRPVSGPHLIWRVGRAEQALVPLPPTTGTWILRGTVVHGDRTELPRNILAVRRSAVHVPPVQLTVDVSQQALTEDGYAWYELALPSPLPVRRVRVQATDDVFQRQAHLIAAPEQPWEEYEITGRMGEPTELIRVAIAGSWLDDTWLPLSGMPSDLLRLYVRTQDEVPLDIPSVLIELEGLDGLVRDPGPGPHRLYGGAPVGTTTQSELQVAAPELARLASRTAAVGAVQANPEHEPPEVRAGLVDPVGVISTRGFRWRAPVTGGPGLVRIPLTEEVLAHAREELHDLRLIDAEGRQIPSFTPPPQRARGLDRPAVRAHRGRLHLADRAEPARHRPHALLDHPAHLR